MHSSTEKKNEFLLEPFMIFWIFWKTEKWNSNEKERKKKNHKISKTKDWIIKENNKTNTHIHRLFLCSPINSKTVVIQILCLRVKRQQNFFLFFRFFLYPSFFVCRSVEMVSRREEKKKWYANMLKYEHLNVFHRMSRTFSFSVSLFLSLYIQCL